MKNPEIVNKIIDKRLDSVKVNKPFYKSFVFYVNY